MAAEEGFEPSQTESESVVLPLHNSAKYFVTFDGRISLTLIIIYVSRQKVKYNFQISTIFFAAAGQARKWGAAHIVRAGGGVYRVMGNGYRIY